MCQCFFIFYFWGLHKLLNWVLEMAYKARTSTSSLGVLDQRSGQSHPSSSSSLDILCVSYNLEIESGFADEIGIIFDFYFLINKDNIALIKCNNNPSNEIQFLIIPDLKSTNQGSTEEYVNLVGSCIPNRFQILCLDYSFMRRGKGSCNTSELCCKN